MTNVQQPGGPTDGRTPATPAMPGTSIPPTETTSPGWQSPAGSGDVPTGTPRQGAHAGSPSGSQSTADTAKEEAANLGESAKDAGRRVAGTAKDEARNVASEAKVQGKRLLDETMHEASQQAKTQQSRAAEGMHAVGGQLREMASSSQQSGMAQQIVGEVGERVDAAARWLEQREPADLLDEVKSFARRSPGTFIAIAGVAGLVAGRLTRGMISQAKDEREQSRASSGAVGAYGSTQSYAGGRDSLADYDRLGDVGGSGAADYPRSDGFERPAGSLGDGPIDPVTGLPASRRETGL